MPRSLLHSISFLLFGLLATAALILHAQTAEDLDLEFSYVLKQRYTQIIARYVESSEFRLSVNAKLDPKATAQPTPYLPSKFSRGEYSEKPLPTLANYAQKIEVQIFFGADVNPQTRQSLQETLIAEAGLKTSRGDLVTVGDLKIEAVEKKDLQMHQLTNERNDLQQKLNLAQNDNTKLNQDLSVRAKQLDDQKRDLEKIKTENTLLQTQKDDLEKQTRDLEAKRAELESKKEALHAWGTTGAIVAAAFLLFLGLILAFRSASGGLGNMAEALRGSLGAVAASISSLSEKGDGGGESTILLKDGSGGGSGDARNAAGVAPITLESGQIKVQQLSKELLELLNVENEIQLLRYISTLIVGRQVDKAYLSLELFGSEKANSFFQRLSMDDQGAIRNFIANMRFDRPKIEMSIDAGEELKSRFLAKDLASTMTIDGETAQALLKINDKQLAEVFVEIDKNLLPRLIAHIDPQRMANVVKEVHALDAERLALISEVILQVPEARWDTSQDELMRENIVRKVDELEKNIQRPFLTYYKTLLERIPDTLGEIMLQKIMEADQTVGEYLGRNIINFSLMFKVSESVLREIVGVLKNPEIAAILHFATDEQKAIVMAGISARRAEMIKDESATMNDLEFRLQKIRYEEAKKKVVTILEQLKKNGQLFMAGEGEEESSQKAS